MKNDTEIREEGIVSGALSQPLSLVLGGDFHMSNATLANHGAQGYYWMMRSVDSSLSNYFLLSNPYDYLDPLYRADRGMGFSVRCVQILHHSL